MADRVCTCCAGAALSHYAAGSGGGCLGGCKLVDDAYPPAVGPSGCMLTTDYDELNCDLKAPAGGRRLCPCWLPE